MLIEEYTDEATGATLKRFKDGVVVAEGDSRGRIWIEKGKEDLVRRLLRDFRASDRSVKLDEEGLLLPEEMTEDQKKKNLGGRPRKASQV